MWSPFKKSEGAVSSVSRSSRIPTNRIIALSSQGLSEPEIIRTLKEEGFSPQQVDQGMQEALKGVISPQQSPPPYQPPPPMQQSPPPYQPPPPMQQSPPPMQQPPRPQQLTPPSSQAPDVQPPRPPATELPKYSSKEFGPKPEMGEDFGRREGELDLPEIPGYRRAERDDDLDTLDEDAPPPLPGRFSPREQTPLPELQSPVERIRSREERVDEMAESIAEEKWSDFRREINEVTNYVKSLEERIEALEKKIGNVPVEKLGQMEEIKTDVDSYKRSISEIAEKTDSVERALKDSLVPMMETLRSLSDAVKSIKGNTQPKPKVVPKIEEDLEKDK